MMCNEKQNWTLREDRSRAESHEEESPDVDMSSLEDKDKQMVLTVTTLPADIDKQVLL